MQQVTRAPSEGESEWRSIFLITTGTKSLFYLLVLHINLQMKLVPMYAVTQPVNNHLAKKYILLQAVHCHKLAKHKKLGLSMFDLV